MTWILDSQLADRDARTNPRDPRNPPHWLRCDYIKDGVRCALGVDHQGDHVEPKPRVETQQA